MATALKDLEFERDDDVIRVMLTSYEPDSATGPLSTGVPERGEESGGGFTWMTVEEARALFNWLAIFLHTQS